VQQRTKDGQARPTSTPYLRFRDLDIPLSLVTHAPRLLSRAYHGPSPPRACKRISVRPTICPRSLLKPSTQQQLYTADPRLLWIYTPFPRELTDVSVPDIPGIPTVPHAAPGKGDKKGSLPLDDIQADVLFVDYV
jgi:hypothetical protein